LGVKILSSNALFLAGKALEHCDSEVKWAPFQSLERTQIRLKKAYKNHQKMLFTTNSDPKKVTGEGQSQAKRIHNQGEFLTVKVVVE